MADDSGLPSYWDAVQVQARELMYRDGVDFASVVLPQALINRSDVVAIFPPLLGSPDQRDRQLQNESSSGLSTSVLDSDETNPTSDDRSSARSLTTAPPSDIWHLAFVEDKVNTNPAPRDNDSSPSAPKVENELNTHPASTSRDSDDALREDRGQQIQNETSSSEGGSSRVGSDQRYPLGGAYSEVYREVVLNEPSAHAGVLDYLLPVQLSKTFYEIHLNNTHTDIQWQPPTNVHGFTDVTYRVQVKENLRYDKWDTIQDSSSLRIGVYRLETLLRIGKRRFEYYPGDKKDVTLRIMAEGRYKDPEVKLWNKYYGWKSKVGRTWSEPITLKICRY